MTSISQTGLPHLSDASLRKTLERVLTVANELQGVVGATGQRAVRLFELTNAGLVEPQPDGSLKSGAKVKQLDLQLGALRGKVDATADAVLGLQTSVQTIDDKLVVQASQVSKLRSTLDFFDANNNSATAAFRAASDALSQLTTRIELGEKNLLVQSQDLRKLRSQFSGTIGVFSGVDQRVNANAEAVSSLTTRVTANEDSITAQATDLTTLKSAVEHPTTGLAATSTALGVLDTFTRVTLDGRVTTNASNITNLQSTVNHPTTGVNATAGAVSSLTTRVTTAEGNISSQASQLTTLTTTVNGNTASINSQATSINGLLVKYGVTLDVNGYITGFQQNNNGTSGEFVVIADKFKIVQPGNTAVAPFEVSGGITYIKQAHIKELQVDKLINGNLNATCTVNGDLNMGAGKIVFDNGAVMKVQGVGFGTSNQFIEWFGPKRAINTCDEASAIYYLKTNGSAYFGGSLSAGTYHNAVRTTLNAATVTLTNGPFLSNGNPRTINYSYSYSNSSSNNGSSIGNGPGGGATVELWRSINGGAFSLIATQSIVFNRSSELEGTWFVNEAGTGAWSFVDNTATAGNYTYELRLVSRTTASVNGTPQQELALSSTEQ